MGSKVYLGGRVATRQGQDRCGEDRESTEIVLRPYRGELTMLDGRPTDGGGANDRARQGPYDDGPTGTAGAGGDFGPGDPDDGPYAGLPAGTAGGFNDDDSDIPF